MTTIMTTSTCKRCGQEKPLEEFLNNRHGVSHVCQSALARSVTKLLRSDMQHSVLRHSQTTLPENSFLN